MSITGERDVGGLKRIGPIVAAARDAMGAPVAPYCAPGWSSRSNHLTTGATTAVRDAGGWILRSNDGTRGAQFEHTLIVTGGRPIVVT